MKKVFIFICFAIVLLPALFFGFQSKKQVDYISDVSQLNNAKYKIGVPNGSAAMLAAEKAFDKAQLKYFTNTVDGYAAVNAGKTDAYVYDHRSLIFAAGNNPKLVILPQSLDSIDIAVGVAPSKKELLPRINEFIRLAIADGTIEDMHNRWSVLRQDKMPDIATPENSNLKLTVGTNGMIEPYAFYGKNGELKGFEIEFTKRLAKYLNADVEFMDLPFDSLIMGLGTGKLDLVIANLNVTQERKKSILFSEPYLKTDVSVVVDKSRVFGADLKKKAENITEKSQLAGKKVAVLTGGLFDLVLKEQVPDAIPIYFNNVPDQLTSLSQGKIDAVMLDEPVARETERTYKGVRFLRPPMTDEDYAFMFSKQNEGLRNEFDAVLAEMKKDGTLKKTDKRWFGSEEDKKFLPKELGERENPIGNLILASNSTYPPFGYIKNNSWAGYEIEIAHLVCKKLGYSLEVKNLDFAAIIPAVISGKVDFAASCITVTEERKKSVSFSQPDYKGGIVFLVRDEVSKKNQSIITTLKQSFKRTFLDEDRYKLIFDGLWATVVISFFSIILGTVLGALICVLRRSGKKYFNIPAKIYISVVQGTPILVLLMILYYVIFAGVQWNAVIIAIIAFAVNFAAYAAEMYRSGLDALDKGQVEAAASMGFSKVQIFIQIIVPQALRYILPVFKGLVIDTVKTTSIVGYIAIQDLTKMSDIIRSRTYEAFFPLIATAIVYYIIAYILAEYLNRCELKLNPKYRKRIIKGVEVKNYDND